MTTVHKSGDVLSNLPTDKDGNLAKTNKGRKAAVEGALKRADEVKNEIIMMSKKFHEATDTTGTKRPISEVAEAEVVKAKK